MDFGLAYQQLKLGNKIRRKDWELKGFFLEIVTPPETARVQHDYIAMETVGLQEENPNAKDRVHWTASQMDILAEDWEIV